MRGKIFETEGKWCGLEIRSPGAEQLVLGKLSLWASVLESEDENMALGAFSKLVFRRQESVCLRPHQSW